MRNVCDCVKEQELKNINLTIFGDGNPEKGLVWIATENRKNILNLLRQFDKFQKIWPFILALLLAAGINGSANIFFESLKQLIK